MKIFEPIKINQMTLKNRIGFPPFGNMPVGDSGTVSDLTVRWYEERAKGGAAFVVTGPLRSTQPRKKKGKGRGSIFTGFGINDDHFIPGFKRLAAAIHAHGTRLGAYLGAGGPVAGQGPSPLPYPNAAYAKDDPVYVVMGYRKEVRELSVAEIEQIEQDIAAGAVRVRTAGVDFVNIPSAHGGISLHGSFLSPFYNRRTDRYGGNWTGRLRFLLETVRQVREAVGEDFPIFVRISADEFLGNMGVTLSDTTEIIVPALEAAGVDCIDVSQGSLHTMEGMTIPGYYSRGCFIHLAEAVKKAAKIPVIGVGNILDLDMAEQFLEQGKTDIIYMGRQLTADPDTPRKYLAGKPEDIRKCICCLGGCGRPCSVNYDIQDTPIPLVKAEKPRKVLVIGGGIGGMEAARISALRGHDVSLVEKDSRLGGTVRALALNPLAAEFGNIVDYLAGQMKALGVDVRVCREATEADVKLFHPDAVILATGAAFVFPEITMGKPGVISHTDALRRKQEIGDRVVVWGLAAADLAISLAGEGRHVVLMGRGGGDTVAKDYPLMRRFWILRRLTDINAVRATPESERLKNPEVLFNAEVKKIHAGKIRTVDKDGRKRTIAYDTLIISRERAVDHSLYDRLKRLVPDIYRVGDGLGAGDIRQAIHSANEVARKI